MKSFCRATLTPLDAPGFTPSAMRKLSGGTSKRVPYRLRFTRKEVIQYRAQESKRLSISGVQDKVSLRLEAGELLPCTKHGEFILKPIPGLDILSFREEVPANEHLTMQLAGQLFGIQTPPCALVELADGEPAYLVRRFDRQTDHTKIPQEDFCQLSNRSEETAGRQYKYNGTQEETGRLLQQYCSAYRVEIEKLYRRHLFNYVFSNGDAHLKNFSLQCSPQGDYLLSPAYDLLCTSLHLPEESRCALDLFDSDETAFFRENGYYGQEDFILLAEKFGIESHYAHQQITAYSAQREHVYHLINQSFLSDAVRQDYRQRFDNRLRAMQKNKSKKNRDTP